MKPKTPQEIKDIRKSGHMLAAVLQYLKPLTIAGVTTKELAVLAAGELKRLGGKPAFLGYDGFPDVICISVNEEVVHGIPDQRVLTDGDLVGLDFGVAYNGMITDAAITVAVGGSDGVSDAAQRLLAATEQAMYAGIEQVKNGAKTGDIAEAIERRLRADKLGVVEDLAGHGVGHAVHEDPIVPNVGRAGRGDHLKTGMTIAIEPMATLGTKHVMWGDDGWTVSTLDGSLAAHFEHTVLVTEGGYEILTQS